MLSNDPAKFSSAFYTLFNELDIATCAYELTIKSSTYVITFGTPASGGVDLETTYHDLVGQLNNTLAT